jgi:hypothetical protein
MGPLLLWHSEHLADQWNLNPISFVPKALGLTGLFCAKYVAFMWPTSTFENVQMRRPCSLHDIVQELLMVVGSTCLSSRLQDGHPRLSDPRLSEAGNHQNILGKVCDWSSHGLQNP